MLTAVCLEPAAIKAEVLGGQTMVPPELRGLIRRIAANPLWGEERIANELLVKLGTRVSPPLSFMSETRSSPSTRMT
jgi:hypothetical protein